MIAAAKLCKSGVCRGKDQQDAPLVWGRDLGQPEALDFGDGASGPASGMIALELRTALAD